MTSIPQIDLDQSLREAMQAAGVDTDDDTTVESPDAEVEVETKEHSSAAGEGKDASPAEIADDSEDVEGADEKPAPDIDEAEIQGAIKALKRDNVPQSQIDRMLKNDPVTLLEWGQQRAKQQLAVDEKFKKHEATSQELSELRRQLKNAGLKTDAGEPPASGDQVVPAQVQEKLDAMRQGIETYFGEDDLAEAIVTPFSDIATSLVKLVEQQFERQEKSLNHFIDEANRVKVADEYPQLEDEDVYRRVQDRMAQIQHLREYESRKDLLLDATQIELGKELAQAALQRQTESRKRRDSGTPKKATGTSAHVTSMTLPELQDAELRARMSGDDARAESIRKRIRKLIS